MAIAIDSNVVLYAFDDDAAEKQRIARAVLRNARAADLAIPLQVCAEVFAVLTRHRKWDADAAHTVVTTLMATMPVCVSSQASLERAMVLSSKHTVSFWDAQVVTASAEFGCGSLLSEDLQDSRRFTAADVGRTFRIVNPFVEANRKILGMLTDDW